MGFIKIVLLVATIPALCNGFIFGRDQSDWNGLKATWGPPLSAHAFASLPRTKDQATRAGWVPMVQGQTGCTESDWSGLKDNPKFLGARYWKDSDLGVILIYDPAGYIAGIQAGVSKNYSPNPNKFPSTQLQNTPMVLDGDTYYITAYFVDPATLCQGRTSAQFTSQGTGTGLWIQNGTNPVTQAIAAPATEAAAEASMWTKGSCFPTMGLHYWYNLDLNMDCDDFFPVFLLYNKGVLNAFGWAFTLDITNSKHFEHPPQSSYGTFMNPPPTCLNGLGTMTTLHIYLTNSASSDLC